MTISKNKKNGVVSMKILHRFHHINTSLSGVAKCRTRLLFFVCLFDCYKRHQTPHTSLYDMNISNPFCLICND